ncbi:MAG: XdhC family protein, partial [Pseudomonadales bacterium]|nr:XdhC family protein [Pseudomonadales bacterium]
QLFQPQHYSPTRLAQQRLTQVFGPRYRLLLVGAGQIARYLAEMALALDFEVILTDPRPELLAAWNGPPITLAGGMPDDAVRHWADGANSAVVTLTHDPRIDDMALMEALNSSAFYVGALGSLRTSAQRRERLEQLDLPKSAIARLDAPIGLPIQSKTPPEIAISILAKLIQVRARVDG